MSASSQPDQARERGRRALLAGYWLVVVSFVALPAASVARQLWPSASESGGKPNTNCALGLVDLASAIERARETATREGSSGEDAALSAFRRALEPEWNRYPALVDACRSNEQQSQTLSLLHRLRYTEEKAVRRDAADLAPLRADVLRRLASSAPLGRETR